MKCPFYLSMTIELHQRSSNDIIFVKFVGNGFQCNLRKTRETGGGGGPLNKYRKRSSKLPISFLTQRLLVSSIGLNLSPSGPSLCVFIGLLDLQPWGRYLAFGS